MSVLQKILLIAACVFYCVTIYGFFNFNVYLIILFFLLHSLCLILFTYRTYAERVETEMDSDTYQQDIGRELAEKNNEINAISEDLEDSLRQIEDLEDDKERLIRDNNELKAELAAIEKEKKDWEKEKAGMDTAEASVKGLLPPVSDGYDKNFTVDIIELANRAKEEMESSARRANLHVSVSSSEKVLPVKADPGRLLIMFKNIIDNSIKYMKRAGSLVITISTINDDIFIVLKDTGQGLPENEIKHIFELNYQGTNRLSGSGLGLSQARAIVEYYGGTIYAKSTEGSGMGIYIQLPAC